MNEWLRNQNQCGLLASKTKTVDRSPTALGSSAVIVADMNIPEIIVLTSISGISSPGWRPSFCRTFESSLSRWPTLFRDIVNNGIPCRSHRKFPSTEARIYIILHHFRTRCCVLIRISRSRLPWTSEIQIWTGCFECPWAVRGGTSWTVLSGEFTHHEEHRLREDQPIVRYFTEVDPGSKSRNMWGIYIWLEYNSMDENYFVERQRCQAVDSSGKRVLWFGTSVWQNYWVSTINKLLEGQNWVVHAVFWISGIGSYWWRTSRVRVDTFPRTHNTAVTSEDERTMEENKVLHEKFEDRIIFMSMYKRHWLENRWKQKQLYVEFFNCCCVRQKISWRTLVILRTRNWRKMVRNGHLQTKRFVEPCCRSDDG